MIKTVNFHPDSDTKLKCTCQHPLCDQRSVKQWVLDKIQLIRNDVKRPLIITSGGRCPNHPNEKRKPKPADHQKCVAVDIAVNDGFERAELVELAFRVGATSICAYDDFVHIGFRDGKKTMWVK